MTDTINEVIANELRNTLTEILTIIKNNRIEKPDSTSVRINDFCLSKLRKSKDFDQLISSVARLCILLSESVYAVKFSSLLSDLSCALMILSISDLENKINRWIIDTSNISEIDEFFDEMYWEWMDLSIHYAQLVLREHSEKWNDMNYSDPITAYSYQTNKLFIDDLKKQWLDVWEYFYFGWPFYVRWDFASLILTNHEISKIYSLQQMKERHGNEIRTMLKDQVFRKNRRKKIWSICLGLWALLLFMLFLI